MARKAASKTRGLTPPQMKAPGPIATQVTDAPRRGRKPMERDVQLSEPALADLFLPGGVEPGSEISTETDSAQSTAMPPVEHDGEPTTESELAGAAADDAVDATRDAAPAKVRRGRRPKAQPETRSELNPITDTGMLMTDALPQELESVVSPQQPSDTDADDASADGARTPPAKLRRGRARKPESATQSLAPQPEQGNDGQMANLPAVDQVEAGAPAADGSAVHWNRGTDTATFDWPAIEHVAAVKGPNQGMAKLLLAARAEGASSCWPF